MQCDSGPAPASTRSIPSSSATTFAIVTRRAHAALEALLADLKSGAKEEVDTVEHGQHGSERIIYTALRDENGAYRGVLETVVPLTDDT